MRVNILLGIIFGLLISIIGVSNYAFKKHQENKRLESNFDVITSELKILKTDNDRYKMEVGVLLLTNQEFEKMHKSIVNDLKDLGVKINQLKSVSTSSVHTETNINTFIKDSISITRDTIKVVEYKDEWISFYGKMIDTVFLVKISNRDSLIQVVWDDRGFFRRVFKFWEQPILKQTISSYNPNSIIKYSEFITLKRK